MVRYHDSIPVLMPHTIKHPGRHHASHQGALLRNARDGAWFACVSETTRRDLVRILPELEERAVTIPVGLPDAVWSMSMAQLDVALPALSLLR